MKLKIPTMSCCFKTPVYIVAYSSRGLMCIGCGLQWHWFIETYMLQPQRLIVFIYEKAFECYHEENELILAHCTGFKLNFYKMICKNFMGFWEAPTIVGYYLLKFSNIHFPKSSKILFLEVLSIKWTRQLE